MSESKIKTTAEVVLDGKTVTIHKLKAGKFYEAQKLIAGILSDVSKLTTALPKPVEPPTDKPVEKGKGKGKASVKKKGEVAPKEDKAPDIEGLDLASVVSLFENFPRQIAEFVAICVNMETKDILEKAYPEEISEAFAVCLELNNVMENLKNSVAPIGKLGAK